MKTGRDGGPSERGRRHVLVLLLWLLCGAALVVVVGGVLVQRTYGVLPPDVDATQLEYPQRVNGDEARSKGELGHLLRYRTPGTVVDLAPPHRRVELIPELDGALFYVTLIGALAFLAVCALVLAPRVGRPGLVPLFGCLMMAALAVGIGGWMPPREGLAHILPFLCILALVFLAPFFVRFALAFPRPSPFLERHGYRVELLFLPAVVIAVWNLIAWGACFEGPCHVQWHATVLPTKLIDFHLVAGMVAGCAILYANGRAATLARERRQAKWILWGMAVGATPYILLVALPRALIGTDLVSPTVCRVVELTVPAAFAIAVAREHFLDIDVIVRRSVLYTVLGLAAAGIFFVLVVGIGTAVSDWAGVTTEVVWAAGGGLTVLLFGRVRRALGRAVDFLFFKIRYTYDRALTQLQGELSAAGGESELAERVSHFLQVVLQPKTYGVAVEGREGWEVHGPVDPVAAEESHARIDPAHLGTGVAIAHPEATAVPEVESPEFPAVLSRLGIELVQAVAQEGRLRGLFLLGEKAAERRYVEEDLRLLAEAATRAARALERMKLVQRVAEETLARRTLAELSREKADFFARLAHDLRSPLTAVRWSTRNLADGLAGPMNERQAQYLQGIEAAAAQLGRLVDNLVDLSRLDLGAPRPAPEALDLHSVAGEVKTALHSLARERDVELTVEAPSSLPAARGDRSAVFQIFMNLVDNALRYAPAGTAVEVELGEVGGGFVEVGVRDRGPGLPDDGREQLFELFRQGPEGERAGGKGFGIGLHVVKAWTDALGGSVSADNHPDGGARFTVRLPVWNPKETS